MVPKGGSLSGDGVGQMVGVSDSPRGQGGERTALSCDVKRTRTELLQKGGEFSGATLHRLPDQGVQSFLGPIGRVGFGWFRGCLGRSGPGSVKG